MDNNGHLRLRSGGFGDPQPAREPLARPTGRQRKPLLESVRELGSRATQRLRREHEEETDADAQQRTRLESGGAASTSDPGTRDFLGKDAPGASSGAPNGQSSDD